MPVLESGAGLPGTFPGRGPASRRPRGGRSARWRGVSLRAGPRVPPGAGGGRAAAGRGGAERRQRRAAAEPVSAGAEGTAPPLRHRAAPGGGRGPAPQTPGWAGGERGPRGTAAPARPSPPARFPPSPCPRVPPPPRCPLRPPCAFPDPGSPLVVLVPAPHLPCARHGGAPPASRTPLRSRCPPHAGCPLRPVSPLSPAFPAPPPCLLRLCSPCGPGIPVPAGVPPVCCVPPASSPVHLPMSPTYPAIATSPHRDATPVRRCSP